MNQELRNNKNKTAQIFLVSALIFILGGVGIYTSAATFDSDVIPGGSYNFTLGQSGTPWQRIFMANGDATNPSYTFSESGYQGTGIFKVPATSTLGFSTNGVERMRITAQGRVGVGTQNPSYLLDVNGTVRVNSCTGCDDLWTLSGSDGYNTNAGNVGVSSTAPAAKLTVGSGAVLFTGTQGSTPVSGAGRRMMWIPAKAAFRAGEVTDGRWDDGNIGMHSVALGYNAYAQGSSSVAIGYSAYTDINAVAGVAIGTNAFVGGTNAVAIGYNAYAQGTNSVAFTNSYTYGDRSFAALGGTANGQYSFAMGENVHADNSRSFVIGKGVGGGLHNNKDTSLAIGFNSDIPTLFIQSSEWTAAGRVAIGTSTVTTWNTPIKFLVEGDANGADMYISRAGSGLILKSPDGGTCAKITLVAGAITSTVVTCP